MFKDTFDSTAFWVSKFHSRYLELQAEGRLGRQIASLGVFQV
jgi:hypothetical protein